MTTQTDFRQFRRQWNGRQKELRHLLGDVDAHRQAIDLFLIQHAVLHTAVVASPPTWSYADELLQDMTVTQMRMIPSSGEHSVTWLLWHMARIEDVALNGLVAGCPQILHEGDWLAQMGVGQHHTGNEMEETEIHDLSRAIDLAALQAYRTAVGRRTREIVTQLAPHALRQKVDPARIAQVLQAGDVIEAAQGITDYWSRRTIAGLLLMPPTRHNLVHLNEIEKVKQKLC